MAMDPQVCMGFAALGTVPIAIGMHNKVSEKRKNRCQQWCSNNTRGTSHMDLTKHVMIVNLQHKQRHLLHWKTKKAVSSMPALGVAGVRWHIASDDVPLFAVFGSAFHAMWIAVILLTSQDVLNMPKQCHHEGRQYIATVVGLLFCFTFGFIVEVLLIWEGCKGAEKRYIASATSSSTALANDLSNVQTRSASLALRDAKINVSVSKVACCRGSF